MGNPVKLSKWSKLGEAPPCPGVWETKAIGDLPGGQCFNYWTGEFWSWSAYSPKAAYKSYKNYPMISFPLKDRYKFRGLAKNPNP